MPALCAIFDTVMVRLLSKDETAPAGDGLGVFDGPEFRGCCEGSQVLGAISAMVSRDVFEFRSRRMFLSTMRSLRVRSVCAWSADRAASACSVASRCRVALMNCCCAASSRSFRSRFSLCRSLSFICVRTFVFAFVLVWERGAGRIHVSCMEIDGYDRWIWIRHMQHTLILTASSRSAEICACGRWRKHGSGSRS